MGIFNVNDFVQDLTGLSQSDITGGSQQTASSQNQSTGLNYGGSTGSTFGQSATGPWAEQQPFLQGLFSNAQNLYQNQSPYTQQYQTALANRAQEGSPLNAAASQGLMDTMSGAYMPGGEKYQDMSSAILNQIRPSVDSLFAGGRFGSGLHKQGLGDQLSDKLITNMNQERQNMMGAMGMAPGQASQDYMDINQLAQAGNVPWQQLQQYQGLLGSPIMTSQAQNLGQNQAFNYGQNQSTGQSQSQGTSQRGHTQGFQDIFGGGGGMMMSDRRLKRNIKKIGELASGLSVYTFEYIWNQKAIGCMADEVKKIFPHAVKQIGGFDAVDYGAIS